jgi:anaerobic ribonucleoside-triphosphate reductase
MEQNTKQEANDRDRLLAENSGERSRCMIFTRVMGYHRPVESFNIGKVGEHRERVLFDESRGAKPE